MKTILVVSHGSQSPKTKQEVAKLVHVLKDKSRAPVIEFAFLEIESPSIPEGIDVCAKKGATEIVILLNFLNSGKHVDVDIPRIVSESQGRHPKVKMRITKPVGQHSKIADLFLEMM